MQRGFGRLIGYGSSTPREQQHYYQTDLGNTRIELRQLIENFDKYGDPRAIQSVAAAVAAGKVATPVVLELPERLTAQWLREHMPWQGWAWAGGVWLSTLLFGVYIGHSKQYADLSASSAEVAAQHSSPALARSPAPTIRPKSASAAH